MSFDEEDPIHRRRYPTAHQRRPRTLHEERPIEQQMARTFKLTGVVMVLILAISTLFMLCVLTGLVLLVTN